MTYEQPAEPAPAVVAGVLRDGRTPAERRGYPLPPWAAEPYLAGIAPTGADVLEYLTGLIADDDGAMRLEGIRQAEAYLDAWLDRHRQAQDTASRCLLEDHPHAVDELTDLRTELRDARAAVRDAYDAGHAAGVELAAAASYLDGLGATGIPLEVVTLDELLEPAGALEPVDARTLGRLADLPLEPVVVDEEPPAPVKCPPLCPCRSSS